MKAGVGDLISMLRMRITQVKTWLIGRLTYLLSQAVQSLAPKVWGSNTYPIPIYSRQVA